MADLDHRADRKGIQPRTIKGMTDEQWALITGAAQRDDLTVAQWVYRAAMAYLSGQAANVAPGRPAARQMEIEAEPLRLTGPEPATRSADRPTAVERAEILERLAAVAATTAALDDRSAWKSLGSLVRANIKGLRSDLAG